jgi:hypothetical protein
MTDERDRLGSFARSLVEAGRTSDAPEDRDRARLRAQLTAALGVSAWAAVGTQAAAAAAVATEGLAAGEGAAVAGAANAAGGAGIGAGAVAHGAGAVGTAAAGSAAATTVSSGFFGALGAKVLVTSVAAVAAAAVGTATVMHRDEVRAPATAHVANASPRQSVPAPSPAARAASEAVAPSFAPARAPDEPKIASIPEVAAARVVRRAVRVHAAPPASEPMAAVVAKPSVEAAAAPAVTELGAAQPVAAALNVPSVAAPAPNSAEAQVTSAPTGVAAPAPHSAEAQATPAPASVAGAAPAPSVAIRVPAAVSSSTPQALGSELSLIAGAQQALRDGQPARALTVLNDHAARHPYGALRPERLAVRAVALCRMGETNAGRAELRKLEAEAPSSPLLRWARTNCGY